MRKVDHLSMDIQKRLSTFVDLFNRTRFSTKIVQVGEVTIGGEAPIRVQSMTTTDTMDTSGSVEQSIKMIQAGCEIVRLTAPSKKEAENLLNIKSALRSAGYNTPLVADIHFTPNAAEIAAGIVEKVRVNPGNYADKKKFEEIEYSDESYQSELKRIEERFTPLVLKCKANGVAMRIGTNHGSLSDRILSRYGDTPEGMVESAMEFLRICLKHDYTDVVISMKASNTLVMVEAYRLLVSTMQAENNRFPLHLGVTEAGDGEDGRIKSAVGIGTLLEDGIGDTIRVSLTEAPEEEIPVAKKLLEKFNSKNYSNIFGLSNYSNQSPFNPFERTRRKSNQIMNIGDHSVPVVIGDLSSVDIIKPSHLFGFGYSYSVPLDKWTFGDAASDYLYIGDRVLGFERPGTCGIIVNYSTWNKHYKNKDGYFPLVSKDELFSYKGKTPCFVEHSAENSEDYLVNYPNAIILLATSFDNKVQLYRKSYLNFAKLGINNPVILLSSPKTEDSETYQLWSSSELGACLIDGFGDGVMLTGKQSSQLQTSTAFGILQATRTRISKTEYISCPSCGRTLFDLQETTAKIRAKTSHLKGVKIGIMGCIVNGPGEMADADYGYVGTGPGKIHLYKEREVVRKNVPEEEAVDALIELIKEHGDWVDENN